MRILIASVFAAILLAGCSSVSKTVVTVTSVVDSAMKEWSALSVDGKTSPEIDAKVIAAHDKYRSACAVVQTAMITYKQTGEQESYQDALVAARTAADGLIDLIAPLLLPNKAVSLKNKLSTANTL